MAVDEVLNIGGKVGVESCDGALRKRRRDLRQLAAPGSSGTQDRDRHGIAVDDHFHAGLDAVQHGRGIPGQIGFRDVHIIRASGARSGRSKPRHRPVSRMRPVLYHAFCGFRFSKLGARLIRLAEAVARVGHRKSAVPLHRDFEPICFAFVRRLRRLIWSRWRWSKRGNGHGR